MYSAEDQAQAPELLLVTTWDHLLATGSQARLQD